MSSLRALTIMLAVAACSGSRLQAAESSFPEGYAPAAAEVGKIVGALSHKNLEKAAELLAARLPIPPTAPKTPFEPSFLDTFCRAYEGFPTDVTQLELVAWQPLSTSSAYLQFVAEAANGPYMVWTLVQQRPNGWVFHGMSYHHLGHPDPGKMKYPPSDLYPILRPGKPISIDLPKPE